MSRLTRDGAVETVSRDQIFRREQDRDIFILPVRLTTSRIGNVSTQWPVIVMYHNKDNHRASKQINKQVHKKVGSRCLRLETM